MNTFFGFAFLLFFCFSTSARIYVNIGAPEKIQKSLIALSSFVPQEGHVNKDILSLGKQMDQRLKKNLKFSAYFHLLSPKAFIENPLETSPVPYPTDVKGFRWKNWKLTGADFLFFANYSTSKNQLYVTIFLYHIHLQKLLLKKKYRGEITHAKRIIDKLSNDIVKSLTGKKGVFETKILSVRSLSKAKKELFIMDWNGENKKRLTYHQSIVLSPAWANTGDQAVYSAFVYNTKKKKRVSSLFLYNFKEKKIKLLSSRGEVNLGSDFSSSDKELFLASSFGRGLLDIFKLNLQSLTLTPLTKGPWGVINVEPSLHSRTGKIAFSSDKGGKTMIYTMGPKGSHPKQLTFAGQYNSNPDWHPEKEELVFSGLSEGRMDLFRISSKGTGLKRLTSLRKKNNQWANCESPSFSPDGRFVVFSSDFSGTYQLYVLNLEDLSIERITFDYHHYKSPKWSPHLHP